MIVLLLCSFTRPAAALEVIFLNPGKPDERFWMMVSETMEAAAEDFGIQLEVVYAQRNRIRMVALGKEILQRPTPPDYLVLVNEEQAAEPILQAAAKGDSKVLLLLNELLPKQRQRLAADRLLNNTLVGSLIPDNFAAGQRMMRRLYQCAKQRFQPPYPLLAIGGDQTTPASIARNAGARAVLAEQPDLKLNRFLYANWSQEEAHRLTSQYLNWAERNSIKPTAIWAANDPIAQGASEALAQHSSTQGQDVCLVGLNWSAQGLSLVRQGKMLLTDGGHFLAGAWAMVLLNDYHQRQQQDSNHSLGKISFVMQSIDQDNIERYLEQLGDENWRKIDFRGFSLADDRAYTDYDFSLINVFNQIRR